MKSCKTMAWAVLGAFLFGAAQDSQAQSAPTQPGVDAKIVQDLFKKWAQAKKELQELEGEQLRRNNPSFGGSLKK